MNIGELVTVKTSSFWDLKNKGIENGFNNIQGAIKLLELKFVEVVDLGDILIYRRSV